MKIDPIFLFIFASILNLIIPSLAYGLLRSKKELGVTIWVYACLCFSIGYILIFLRVLSFPTWVTYELAQFFVISGFSTFILVFRKNLSLPTNKYNLAFLAFLYLFIFSVLFRLDLPAARQIFVHLTYSIFSFFLLRYSLMLRDITQSKSILFCTTAYAISFLADLIRILAIASENSTKNPIDLSWDSLIVSISVPVFIMLINYGFFGYIVERIVLLEQQSNFEKLEAIREKTIIEQREHALSEALKERDRMLEIASHADRLSTLDLLASNIAHELNQPLGALMLNISTLKSQYNYNDSDVEFIHSILDDLDYDCQRINNVFSRIRSLSRQHTLEIEAVLLSDVVSAAMELVKGQVKENNIKLSLEIKNHDIWIQGDTVLLLQVFLNVIVNAIHAVTKSQNETNKICISLEHDDRNVSVFIDDNGPGFHPNIKHQLFHQAYTSKNHGTGIGLLLCHTIMKRFGGDIKVNQSELGGARIELTFLIA